MRNFHSIISLFSSLSFVRNSSSHLNAMFNSKGTSSIENELVAIIGGGQAGLIASKMLNEKGIENALFTALSMGGMWNELNSKSWSNLKTNLSKYACSFVDLPWSDQAPTFPTKNDINEYLKAYCEKFSKKTDIYEYSTVTSIRRVSDEKSGYEVTWIFEKGGTPEIKTKIFQNVIIANGFFNKPNKFDVSIEGQSCNGESQVDIVHSGDYKDSQKFRNKKVVIVGSSFSGIEIATEVALVAKKVYHIVSDSSPLPWVLPRYIPLDSSSPSTPFLPLDIAFYRSPNLASIPEEKIFRTKDDRKARNEYMRKLVGGSVHDVFHRFRPFQWTAEANSTSQLRVFSGQTADENQHVHVAISDIYHRLVRSNDITLVSGRLKKVRVGDDSLQCDGARSMDGTGLTHQRMNLSIERKFEVNGIVLDGETVSLPLKTQLDGVDSIIMCTGYRPDLSFLDAETLQILTGAEDEQLLDASMVHHEIRSRQKAFNPLILHQDILHPKLPGLFFVGMYRAPYFGVMDMQAKLVASYITGDLPMPSTTEMDDGLELSRRIRNQLPIPQATHPDYVGLLASLAKQLNLVPTVVRSNESSPSPSMFPLSESLIVPAKFQPQSTVPVAARYPKLKLGMRSNFVLPNSVLSNGNSNRFQFRLFSTSIDGQQDCSFKAIDPMTTEVTTQEIVSNYLEDDLMDYHLHGKHIPYSVFQSLEGSWDFTRVLTSRSASMPSGKVVGRIRWVRSKKGTMHELIYEEEGQFTTESGATYDVTGTRYIFVLKPKADSESDSSATSEDYKIEVYFADKNNRDEKDYLFQTLESFQPVTDTNNTDKEVISPGWVVHGKEPHLCGSDVYLATYTFSFHGVALDRVTIRFEVKGLSKDYTSTTLMTRSQ